MVWIDTKQFERAIHDCDAAIKINPMWIKAYLRKAIAIQNLAFTETIEEQALAVLK